MCYGVFMIIAPWSYVWNYVKRIDSALTERESSILYQYSCIAGKGCIVEIGSYLGRSSCSLGFGARATGRVVFCVDHHKGDDQSGHITDQNGNVLSTFGSFVKNVKMLNLWGTVIPIVSDSVEAGKTWNKTYIDLLFIDGYHTKVGCLNDFNAFYKHLRDGSHVIFHDYERNIKTFGVKEAVNELQDNGILSIVDTVDSMAITKISPRKL